MSETHRENKSHKHSLQEPDLNPQPGGLHRSALTYALLGTPTTP